MERTKSGAQRACSIRPRCIWGNPTAKPIYTPSSAEVKERVELYLYSPSGPSWPVLV
jgi:hypothetical protein